MVYFEVDGDRVHDLLEDLYSPVIKETLTKRNALKIYPEVSTDIARRTGMIQVLCHLDLLDDQEHDRLKEYLETELKKFSDVLKVGKLFK